MNTGFLGHAVATVLTVYGIETLYLAAMFIYDFFVSVATVLTVYGIETEVEDGPSTTNIKLQQYLPFTVLKPV